MNYKYKTKGTCSSEIIFDLNDSIVTNISFRGGCQGNLFAISKLCHGMSVSEIEKKLKGNICGSRGTSCADQLALAVREAYDKVV